MADFVIREWTIAPYPGDQAPPHIHHNSDEAFYVLDGRLEVLSGAERTLLGPGEMAFIGAGTVHTFANHGPENARILVVMTPEIDELITALHLHADEGGEDRSATWARYRSSIAKD